MQAVWVESMKAESALDDLSDERLRVFLKQHQFAIQKTALDKSLTLLSANRRKVKR